MVALFICRGTSDIPSMCSADGRHTTKGRRAPFTCGVDVSGFWIDRCLVGATAPAGLLCIQNPPKIQKTINILWKTSLSGKWNCLGKHRCTVTLVVSLNSLVCINCFEILQWDVLGKQKNYFKVQGSAFFFILRYSSCLIFNLWSLLLQLLLLFFFFSYPDLFLTKWNCPRQRICST